MMRLFGWFLVLALVVVIPFLIWGRGFERSFSQEGAVAWLAGHGRWAGVAGILLLMSDLVLPIPATAVMAALGFVYGPVAGGLIAAVGGFLSGALGYLLCRWFGRPVAVRLLGPRDMIEGERLFAQVGGWLVVLSRWLPVFPEVIACMAGLSRMPPWPFFTALACGSAPLGFVFAAIGHAGVDRPVLAVALSAGLPPLLWLGVQPYFRAKRLTQVDQSPRGGRGRQA
ncbi:MAG TPA: VTT domain-containing protein [Geminicoccaceae bacterium]|nr:VTT domain-containing protein [Geminicoccaceae bacterium]